MENDAKTAHANFVSNPLFGTIHKKALFYPPG